MLETGRYNPHHDFDHTRESQDYKNMDYKDRVQFHFEELWGEWKMRESAINQNKDFNENIDNESLRPEELKLLEILEEIGIDSEDKSGKGDFFHTDEELLGCLNDDNSINYEQLKKVLLKEAEHRAKDLPVKDPFNKGEKKVAKIPLPTNPESPTIVTGSGNGLELRENERYERKKHLLRIFRKRNLQFSPVFIDFDALSAMQKEKYVNMFRTIALDKRDGDVIHPGQYDVYVVPEKGLTFMVSDKYAEATYVVDNAPEDMEDIIKTIGFNKEKKDEAEYPVAVIEWPDKGTMEDWRKLIEDFLDDPEMFFVKAESETESTVYDSPPDGWFSIHKISIILQRDWHWIQREITKILDLEENPDTERTTLLSGPGGRLITYYSPKLIEQVQEKSERDKDSFMDRIFNNAKLGLVLGKLLRDYSVSNDTSNLTFLDLCDNCSASDLDKKILNDFDLMDKHPIYFLTNASKYMPMATRNKMKSLIVAFADFVERYINANIVAGQDIDSIDFGSDKYQVEFEEFLSLERKKINRKRIDIFSICSDYKLLCLLAVIMPKMSFINNAENKIISNIPEGYPPDDLKFLQDKYNLEMRAHAISQKIKYDFYKKYNLLQKCSDTQVKEIIKKIHSEVTKYVELHLSDSNEIELIINSAEYKQFIEDVMARIKDC